MKFGKVIHRIGEELPDRHFLRYKELKKLLKHIKGAESRAEELAKPVRSASKGKDGKEEGDVREASPGALSAEETEFIKALNEELSGLNNYYMDAEEKVVIRLQALEAQLNQVQETKDQGLLQSMKAALIDFHGEIVLLLHWGLLNYAAVTKILKKHDKQTGVALRTPYLEAVLKQPFYSTDLLGRLAKRVANIVEQLVEPDSSPKATDKSVHGLQERTLGVSAMSEKVRMTQMALGTWQELGNNASTPSTVMPTRGQDNLGVVHETITRQPCAQDSCAGKTDREHCLEKSPAAKKRKLDCTTYGKGDSSHHHVSQRIRE